MTIQIAPNNASLVYSPSNWRIQASEARTINPGAYCRALIAGSPSSIALTFDLTGVSMTYPPQITYRIDKGPAQTVPIASTINIPAPGTNTWDRHLVEFWVKSTTETVNRWAGTQAAVAFTGLVCSDGAGAEAVDSSAVRGVVFGDSITEGIRTARLTDAGTGDTQGDAALGWAFALRDLLGAEVGVVGFGGTSWAAPGSGGVPPFPDFWDELWGGVPRSLSGLDFVVVNMGTNGGAAQSVMQSTFASIRAAAPNARLIVLRPFGGQQAATLAAAVAALSDDMVTYVDTTGWWSTAESSDGLHPYGYANLAHLGPRVAAAVRDALGLNPFQASHFVSDAQGNAVPVS